MGGLLQEVLGTT